jgi:hypothetical protein
MATAAGYLYIMGAPVPTRRLEGLWCQSPVRSLAVPTRAMRSASAAARTSAAAEGWPSARPNAREQTMADLNTWQNGAQIRLHALMHDGRTLLSTSVYPTPGRGRVDYGRFHGWRSQAISALGSLIGTTAQYTVEFDRRVKDYYISNVEAGLAILAALQSDISNGYLRTTANIISAEVFGDFLEMAQHLLDEGYKDPSASLTGAVLEDGLRRIARNNDITVNDGDDLSSLRDKCAGKKIFNNLVRQQITAWTTLRNSADHGKFSEYTAQQVASMISDVRSFLGSHIG